MRHQQLQNFRENRNLDQMLQLRLLCFLPSCHPERKVGKLVKEKIGPVRIDYILIIRGNMSFDLIDAANIFYVYPSYIHFCKAKHVTNN